MYKLKSEVSIPVSFDTKNYRSHSDLLKSAAKYWQRQEESDELSKIAIDNASVVLHTVTRIEAEIGEIISEYFFAGHEQTDEAFDRAVLFDELFIESSMLTYNAKRQILFRILEQTKYCTGKEKAAMQMDLKRVQEWRNAVAHGSFTIDAETLEISLAYHSGGSKSQVLNTDFWMEFDHTAVRIKKTLSKVSCAILKERGCHAKLGDDFDFNFDSEARKIWDDDLDEEK